MAGCEWSDLVRLVQRDGVEGALGALYRAGVFLRVDEAKGRQPVVRGAERFTVRPGDLHNPLLATHFRMHTGGSGGAPATIPIDVATVRDRAINRQILLEARGGIDATYVEWGVPGSQTLFTVIEYACAGLPVRHWLLKVDPASPELHAAYRWSLRLTRWASLARGTSPGAAGARPARPGGRRGAPDGRDHPGRRTRLAQRDGERRAWRSPPPR